MASTKTVLSSAAPLLPHKKRKDSSTSNVSSIGVGSCSTDKDTKTDVEEHTNIHRHDKNVGTGASSRESSTVPEEVTVGEAQIQVHEKEKANDTIQTPSLQVVVQAEDAEKRELRSRLRSASVETPDSRCLKHAEGDASLARKKRSLSDCQQKQQHKAQHKVHFTKCEEPATPSIASTVTAGSKDDTVASKLLKSNSTAKAMDPVQSNSTSYTENDIEENLALMKSKAVKIEKHDGEEGDDAAAAATTTTAAFRCLPDSNTTSVGDVSLNNKSACNTKMKICENRLPSKKRKGSHDYSFQSSQHQHRKGSHDLSVSFDDSQSNNQKKLRKGSYDLSVTFEDVLGRSLRSRTDSTAASSLNVVDVLISPRKHSNATGSSTGSFLPGLGEPPVYENTARRENDKPKESATGEGTSSNNHHSNHLDISDLEQLDGMSKHNTESHMNKEKDHTTTTFASQKGTAGKSLDGDDLSLGNDTFASSGHRLLIEAIMMSTGSGGGSASGGEKSNSAVPTPSENVASLLHAGSHFNVLGGGREYATRDRLESWGGMSDLSLPLGCDSTVMANLTGTWQYTDLATANESPFGEQPSFLDDRPGAVPSRILLGGGRDRLNSLASLSEASLGMGGVGQLLPMAGHSSNLAGSVVDITTAGDIQEYVAAAMASIGDQLAELAGAVEGAANSTDSVFSKEFKLDDEMSNTDTSNSQPFIGAVPDHYESTSKIGRPRSWSMSSEKISVDYDAVQAAVDAAEAASGSLGLTSTAKKKKKESASKKVSSRIPRRKLPLKSSRPVESPASSSSSGSDAKTPDLARIRQRARAAALSAMKPSKVQSSAGLSAKKKRSSPKTPAVTSTAKKKPKEKKSTSPKKRVTKKSASQSPVEVQAVSSNEEIMAVVTTPKVANKKILDDDVEQAVPVIPLSNNDAKNEQAKQQGQSNQKWESMFECLVEFVSIRKEEETSTLSEKEKEEWIWDGNVPTTYKSKDGKALGRWVNNQRSAKSKGALKDDREQRLINVGLKWSVLASNSWNLMLDELSIYINEQTEKGLKWDGNVPTNYQIKTKPDSYFAGEDKNLGRWVNRQRSMFQAGKLRKDRQLALEKIGLKWSMLATTSWDTMYETLVEYVEQQKKEIKTWDGNVPANYRTEDNPPRSLGRWINRQRSAYMKKKLKQEYVDKLNALGLKWSVHNRHGENDDNDDGKDDGDDSDNSDTDDKSKDSVPMKESTNIEQRPCKVEEPCRKIDIESFAERVTHASGKEAGSAVSVTGPINVSDDSTTAKENSTTEEQHEGSSDKASSLNSSEDPDSTRPKTEPNVLKGEPISIETAEV